MMGMEARAVLSIRGSGLSLIYGNFSRKRRGAPAGPGTFPVQEYNTGPEMPISGAFPAGG
jgi:hypothetical protein